jgi:hypothetical protein
VDPEAANFVPQVRAASPLFQTIAEPSPGPWRFEVTCKRGEELAFRVRESKGARTYSRPVAFACGD